MTGHRSSQCYALLLTALIGFLWSLPVFAVDPDKAFHHYVRSAWSIQAGLPQISVQAISQDPKGYIWVGTQSGLARFDGIRFTTYNPETEPALPGAWIRSLLTDSKGRLWIGTYKGIAVYEAGRFRTVPIADVKSFPTIDVFAMVESADGGLIAATNSGVFDLRDDKLVHRSGSPAPAQSLLKHKDGLLVGSLGGIYRLSDGNSSFMPLPPEAAQAGVNQVADSQGFLWAGTSQGLYLLSGNSWKLAIENPIARTSPVNMLFTDRDRNLWVGTSSGLARFNNAHFPELIPDTSPSAFKGVGSAFEDHEGNLWLGSQWEGLARIWNGWTRRYSTYEGMIEPIIWSLSRAPDGRVWVGNADGLGTLSNGVYQTVLRGNQLPHPHAYNILAEADRVWIGTRRGLVVWRDGKIEAPSVFAPMASVQINGVVRGRDEVLWIPTTEGLFRLKDGKLSNFGQKEGLANIRIRVVRELRDGRILVGTQSGLYELRDERMVELGLKQGLSPNLDVTAIYELNSGEWAIGTLDEDVFMFNGHKWQIFGRKQGMPANAPFFITEDSSGWLWVTGIRGILRMPVAQMLDLAGGKRQTVDAEMVLNERGDRRSGQQGYCCNGAGNSKGFIFDDVLWLPTRDGVVTLDTRTILKNKKPPQVIIERIEVKGEWQDIVAGEKIELPSNSRDLGFEFTALSFQEPISVQLRYRLVGYDEKWRDLEVVSPRAANYTNLPAGNYSFEVMAANNAELWNPVPAKFSFRIKPFFYETPWFYLLLALLLGLLLYLALRHQKRSHDVQRAHLEQEVLERTEQLHAANLLLETASQTDPLTGLRNRRYLTNQLPADISFYDREHKRVGGIRQSLVFALVDIDHFKHVNDTYGHGAGDRVLQQFAEVLTRLVRTGDYIVRWGGEEFLLVFRPMPRQYVSTIGNRIRQSVAAQKFVISEDTSLEITCSVGLAEYPIAGDKDFELHWEQMVELADAALYWVKRNGRDGWASLYLTDKTDLAELTRGLLAGSETLIESNMLTVRSSKDAGPTDVNHDDDKSPTDHIPAGK